MSPPIRNTRQVHSPSHLVTIIHLWVVRGRHHHACARLQVGNPERHERRGDRSAEEVDAEALRDEDRGGNVREALGRNPRLSERASPTPT